MRALTYQGKRVVRVETVPDPRIQDATDINVRITSSGICGSDLHLCEVLGPYLDPRDILGHEPMGIVEEVGREVTGVVPGDRVVILFNVSCGHCYMCGQGLHSQCETTQVWVDDLLPLLTDDDPLGVDSFATHHLPLEEGPKAYETFRKKGDGMIKTLLIP
ncbi:alcohol dehydrogenase catalytic domain-containing protein [Streptomyces rubiginosohelvolus]